MKVGLVHFDVAFMESQRPAEYAKSTIRPLDNPGSAMSSQYSAIPQSVANPASTMRPDQLDRARPAHDPKPMCVVGEKRFRFAMRFGAMLARHAHRFERRFGKRDLCGRRRRQGHYQRYTRAVCHHHPLRTLSTLGSSDASPPFFAGAKLPSINASFHFNASGSSSFANNAPHAPRHSHTCSRRQHILSDWIRLGRSFQRARLCNTQRMLFVQARRPIGSRPPRGDGFGCGINGVNFALGSTVISMNRLAIEKTFYDLRVRPIFSYRSCVRKTLHSRGYETVSRLPPAALLGWRFEAPNLARYISYSLHTEMLL